MKMRLLTGLALVGGSVYCLTATAPADAQQFLVGAYLFDANSSGATVNSGYQYDTNSSGGASPLNVNGFGKGISFSLPNGSTSFTFDQGLNTPLSGFGDLGLFFSTSNTPFNPSTTSRTPDLLVARNPSGGAAFFVPVVGTSINNYAYPGSASANGLSVFSLGGSTISVTAYSVAAKPNGSFTLQVNPTAAATPEPGSLALLAGLGFSGILFLKRRKK
jgi:hypothetical protein